MELWIKKLNDIDHNNKIKFNDLSYVKIFSSHMNFRKNPLLYSEGPNIVLYN